jgi:hypothetical protein
LLNANDFFANASGQPRPPFKFNQFGGTLGGPVVVPGVYDGRNRTFLFAGVELVRFLQGITFTGTVPRPDQLAGDFSTARNGAGAWSRSMIRRRRGPILPAVSSALLLRET